MEFKRELREIERGERESLGEWGQIFRERAARGEKIKASSHKVRGLVPNF